MKRLLLIFVLVGLSGCANELLSDNRIAQDTADALGVPESSVHISGRQYNGGVNTYYEATTATGTTYHCSINGGTLLSGGLTNVPNCSR